MEGLWATWLRPKILKFEDERREAAPKRLVLFAKIAVGLILGLYFLAWLRGDLGSARQAFKHATLLITLNGAVFLWMLLTGIGFLFAPTLATIAGTVEVVKKVPQS